MYACGGNRIQEKFLSNFGFFDANEILNIKPFERIIFRLNCYFAIYWKLFSNRLDFLFLPNQQKIAHIMAQISPFSIKIEFKNSETENDDDQMFLTGLKKKIVVFILIQNPKQCMYL